MTPRRRLTAALALLGLLSAASAAQALDGQLFGGGTISGFNQACHDVGWQENSLPYSVRFHPAGVGYNPPNDSITFINNDHAFGFEHPTGPFTSSFQPVTHGGVFRQPWIIAHDHPRLAAELRITSMNPSVVTANTAVSVRIRGVIRNFSGIRDCRATFDVIVQHRR